MTTFTPLFRALGTAALVASLAACTSSKPVAAPPMPKLTDMLSQASQAEKTGNKEQAVTLWKKAASAYPTDKTAWGNVAKTRFDSGLYGDAIVAAQEVLIRDPNDKAAHSIIVASGVRLAAKSVGDLSRINGFSGNLRTEAMELQRVLQTSLGVQGEILADKADTKEPPPVVKKPRVRPPVIKKPAGDKPTADDLMGILNGK